jgi:hypothetical protein
MEAWVKEGRQNLTYIVLESVGAALFFTSLITTYNKLIIKKYFVINFSFNSSL